MLLSEIECAYLAGLFDGEGTIGYYFKGSIGYHRAQIAIYNSDPRIMQWIKERISFGSVASNKNTKYKCWGWIVNSRRDVEAFLLIIRPYLVIKANQVDLLLSMWDAEQKLRGGKKRGRLSPEIRYLRVETEKQLKFSKTAAFVHTH